MFARDAEPIRIDSLERPAGGVERSASLASNGANVIADADVAGGPLRAGVRRRGHAGGVRERQRGDRDFGNRDLTGFADGAGTAG
jgi:hypothetical protein